MSRARPVRRTHDRTLLRLELRAGGTKTRLVAVVSFLMTLLAGYFLGSIPTGYLVARVRGVDIRSVGSGNIGATNVFRVLGKPAGVFVLLADAAKGWLAARLLPAWIAAWLGVNAPADSSPLEWLMVAGGFAAVLGHNYTCWLRFRGGKGIATSAGVLLGWFPWAMWIAFIGIGVAVFTWGFISKGFSFLF